MRAFLQSRIALPTGRSRFYYDRLLALVLLLVLHAASTASSEAFAVWRRCRCQTLESWHVAEKGHHIV